METQHSTESLHLINFPGIPFAHVNIASLFWSPKLWFVFEVPVFLNQATVCVLKAVKHNRFDIVVFAVALLRKMYWPKRGKWLCGEPPSAFGQFSATSFQRWSCLARRLRNHAKYFFGAILRTHLNPLRHVIQSHQCYFAQYHCHCQRLYLLGQLFQ